MRAAKAQRRRSHVGDYQLLAKIGEGGMGTVHLAKMDGPAGFNKLAVLKELRADLNDSREFRQMFLDEARLAARLTHPNVVHTYGANEDDGRLYLAMEYLDGQPWSRIRHALWQRGSLPFGLHLKVLAEALAGLHYAHELRDYDGTPLQVVHCDMSPQNVFVTYDGQVKVVDFGVARGVSGKGRPAPDVIVGKLAYIAPEQARGEEVDRRADVFSMGVMLWEALAGRRFAEGQDLSELRRRRSTGAEPRVRELAPNVPSGLAEICDCALALDPNDRFATAADFREALLHFLGEEMQDVDHVRVGELVSGAFEQDRTHIHALIERHLKGSTGLKGSIEDLVASLHPGEQVEHTLKADLSELASVSRLRDEVAVIEASNSASIRLERRRPPLALLGVAACVIGLGSWLALRPNQTPAKIAASPLPPLTAAEPAKPEVVHAAAQPAPSSPRDPTPLLVQLVITANPPEALLQLDGAQLRGNPYAARVHADSREHVIRASAPGLQTEERVIDLDRDRVVSFNLSSSRSVRGVVRAPRRAPSNPPVAPAAVVAQSPVEAPAAVRGNDTNLTARARSKAGDGFDAPLKTEQTSRPIYDEDPYR